MDFSSLTLYGVSGSIDTYFNSLQSLTLKFLVSSRVAPVAPEITSVEYFNSLLYISWTYGDDTTDLSHSRMLHWMVVAEGKKKIKKSVCVFESLHRASGHLLA